MRAEELNQTVVASEQRAETERRREAQHRGLRGWQIAMGFGFLLWVLLFVGEMQGWIHEDESSLTIALVQLLAGITILQGACEAFIQGVERLGARFRWEVFISGTVGSVVATLP